MTRQYRPTTSPTQDASTPPLPRWTNDALDALGRRFPEWARSLPAEEPVYAIPEVAIEQHALTTVFDGERLEAELAFSQVCHQCQLVGRWRSSTIAYPLLTLPPLNLDDPAIRSFGWSTQQLEVIAEIAGRASVVSERLQGVVGWLLTEPAFLNDVARLRTAYVALPAGERPRFPLSRTVWNLPANSPIVPSAVAVGFRAAIRQFLDQWGLMQLATWDLPEPQGPLLPNGLPDGAPANPLHGIHLYIPIHYPFQGDDDLLQQVRDFQRQQAVQLGVDPGFGGIAHHEQYAQMFRLIHLERAIRSRFPDRAPRGLAAAIEAAGSALLSIGTDSVSRLRKWVSACRRGGRRTIRRLRG